MYSGNLFEFSTFHNLFYVNISLVDFKLTLSMKNSHITIRCTLRILADRYEQTVLTMKIDFDISCKLSL